MRIAWLSDDKHFKTAVTVLLAGLTVFGSGILILNVMATARAAEAGRDSRILGIRYTTHLGRSLWEAVSEQKLMVSWQELGGLMLQSEAYEKMTRGKDASLYRLTRERLGKVRDLLAAQGEVTKAPYFDGRAGVFDFAMYYLDRVFVPASELLERQEVKRKEGAFWTSKAAALTTALAVMAVAVFLLTLSLVLAGKIRFFMAGAGLTLILAIAIVAAATAVRTWKGPAEESVKSLARASGTLFRAQAIMEFGGDVRAADLIADQAAADLDRILSRDPEYTAALLLRSRTHQLKGEALLYAGRAEEGRAEMGPAVEGLTRVIRAGREDGYLWWSLAYGELLLGRTAEALRSVDKALAAVPDQRFALGVVKATILLLEKKKEAARQELEEAIAFALRHPLASDAVSYRTIIRNLERKNEVETDDGLAELIRRLKEASVCYAVFQKARPEPGTSSLAALQFVSPIYDKYGDVVDATPNDRFPRGTARAYFLLDFKSMKKDLSIVTKVFWKAPGQVFWVEQLRLGKSQHWEGPDFARLLGFAAFPIPEAGEVLATGEYRIEIYLGGALAATGSFQVL